METGTIDAVLDAMIQKSREANPEQPDDYLNENGLLICGRCGTPKEAMIPFPDGKLRKVRVACTCKRKAHEKEQEELRRMEVQRRIRELRRQGIGDTVCQTWTFANDRGYNPEQMRICQRYVEQWAKVRSENIGLLLYGGVGAGKSYAAYCIANALIDKGIFVLATSLPKLLSSIQSNFGDQSEVLKDVEEAELVLIDDMGVERDSSFGQEKVFEVMDTRIKSGRPLIITTNLAQKDFKEAGLAYQRIYDRILGVCHPVEFPGKSLRMQAAKERREEIKRLLEGEA